MTRPADEVPRPKPRSWVIDVCRICDRLAQWPFCEHREQWQIAALNDASLRDKSWCVSVTVIPRRRSERTR